MTLAPRTVSVYSALALAAGTLAYFVWFRREIAQPEPVHVRPASDIDVPPAP